MKNTHMINQLNRIRKLVQAIDTDWEYAQCVGRAQKEAAVQAIVELRDKLEKDSSNNSENKKQAELEAILDQLYAWCQRYRENYATTYISTDDEGTIGGAWNDRRRPDPIEIHKEYKKDSAAATAKSPDSK